MTAFDKISAGLHDALDHARNRANFNDPRWNEERKARMDRVSGWRTIDSAPRVLEFRCLLAHPFSVVTGYWDGEGWRNERSAIGGYFPATHWMPLPAPPTQP